MLQAKSLVSLYYEIFRQDKIRST